MDPSSIIPTLLDTATKIFTVVLDNRRSQQLKANHAAADLMEGVSVTLTQTAEMLGQGVYPANCCGRLREYALLMPDVLKPCIEDFNIDRYTVMLLENYQVEMILGYFQKIKPFERERQLDQLRSAAGAFRVASEMLRPE